MLQTSNQTSKAKLPDKLPNELKQQLRIGDQPLSIADMCGRGYVVNPQGIEAARQFFAKFGWNAPEHNDVIDLLDLVDPMWRGYSVPGVKSAILAIRIAKNSRSGLSSGQSLKRKKPDRFDFRVKELALVDLNDPNWVPVAKAAKILGYSSEQGLRHIISAGKFMPNIELRRGRSQNSSRIILYLNTAKISERLSDEYPITCSSVSA